MDTTTYGPGPCWKKRHAKDKPDGSQDYDSRIVESSFRVATFPSDMHSFNDDKQIPSKRDLKEQHDSPEKQKNVRFADPRPENTRLSNAAIVTRFPRDRGLADAWNRR
jgi:hypothetical protein